MNLRKSEAGFSLIGRDIATNRPFSSGDPADVIGRIIAKSMFDILEQTVVIENKSGANAMIGGVLID
jgi:tripartite-type tricarboxylate transporter receptor subunit TctC